MSDKTLPKFVVDLAELREIDRRRKEINARPFDQIHWTDGGEPFTFPDGMIRYFKLSGLANSSILMVLEEKTSFFVAFLDGMKKDNEASQ